jgi:hypothetical protein
MVRDLRIVPSRCGAVVPGEAKVNIAGAATAELDLVSSVASIAAAADGSR